MSSQMNLLGDSEEQWMLGPAVLSKSYFSCNFFYQPCPVRVLLSHEWTFHRFYSQFLHSSAFKTNNENNYIQTLLHHLFNTVQHVIFSMSL